MGIRKRKPGVGRRGKESPRSEKFNPLELLALREVLIQAPGL